MQTFNNYMATKDAIFGVFCKTNDPFFIEVIGRAGFDFVVLDNEHGPNSPRDTYNLITAAQCCGLYPIIRVSQLSAVEVQRALDLSPAGIQIPQIQCKQDAENVIRFSKYHPKGKRGLCGYVRAANFFLPTERSFFETQNELTTVIHIEGDEGIEAFDEIAAVDDIDVIFIGPYDLSQSLGVPGQADHPKVLAEIEKLIVKCRARDKNVGIFAATLETARRYKDMGVKYITYSTDLGILAHACTDVVAQLKQL